MTINGIDYSTGTPIYILDENFRCFRPEKLTTVAVNGDNDSSAIILKTPRYYKNLDLSQISAWIYWSTEWLDDEGKPSQGRKSLLNFEVDESNITYLWLLDLGQTYKKGKVNFGIGWADNDWQLNTKGNYFVVQKFVDRQEGYIAPDIAEQLQQEINALNTSVTELSQNKADLSYVNEELNLKQDKTDNNLETTNKTVVGAINELNSGKQDKFGELGDNNVLETDVTMVFYLQPPVAINNPTIPEHLTNKSYVDQADQNLQEQIDAIASSSDVVDVVGTYAELEAYDTQHLKNNDIVKVLQDETKDDAITYYRWVIINHVGSWEYIGSSGPYYTKGETDALLDEKQNTLIAGENITIENNVISATSGGTVDQHYDPTSTNAQSGTAVAEAMVTKQDNMGVEITQNNLIFDKKPVFLGGAISDSNPISAGYLTRKDYVDTEISNHHDSTKADKSTVDNHIADKSNPHEVTKTQVGLGNVDNTSDLNKPISTAAQAALDLKANSADVYTKSATDTLLDGKENIVRDITPYIDYSVDSQTDEVTITNLKSGVTPSSLVGRFNIPDKIDDKTVTAIGNTCFNDCVNADFILPITLKTIGGSSYSSGAFSNTNISNITLSAGVTLGAGAFANCLNLKSVYIPDGAILGNGNFFNCANLTQVEFGGSITPNENIFRGCSLYQVTLPETVTSIPQSVFYNNTSLKKVYLPKSITSVNAQNSFYGVTLTDLYFGGTEAEFNDKTYKTVFTNMSGITIHYNCKPAIMQDIYDYHDSTKQNITDNSLNTTNKTIPTAINEVYAMALGSQTGIAYTDYKSMIDTFNILPADDFFVGKNIYIQTVDVPDLWIESNDESTSVPYDIFSHLTDAEAPTFVANKYYEKISNEYVVLTTEPANWSTDWTDYYFVDDDSFVSTLETNGYVQVGYYKLAKLETAKVDLSNYYTKSQTDTLLAPKLTEPSSNLAVGKYFRVASIDNDGHAVLECVDAPIPPNAKSGSSAPTTSTVGYVGQCYIDTSSPAYAQTYICIKAENNVYTWKPFLLNMTGNGIILSEYTGSFNKDEAVGIGRYANVANYGTCIGYRAAAKETAVGIGHTARANASNSIQLGSGTNSTASTFQVFNYRMLEANGTIPLDRMLLRKASLDNVLVPGYSYDLGSTEQASVTLTLPNVPLGSKSVSELNDSSLTKNTGDIYILTDSGTLTSGNIAVVAGDWVQWAGTAWTKISSYSCNDIYVAFKSGSTATTLSIVGTYEGDTSYLPSADSICELSFKYICGTWVLVTKETAISST